MNELLQKSTRTGPDVDKAVDELFIYREWTREDISHGSRVREALAAAVKVIIDNVPPSPTRTTAIRKIVEARMDCNLAITFGGKY